MSARQTLRNDEMRELRRAGHTLQDIADRYGLTRQRVGQLIGGVEVPDGVEVVGRRRRKREELRAQRTEMLRPLLASEQPVTFVRAAEVTGIPLPVVSEIARAEGWSRARQRWTRDECLAAMDEWHRTYGKPPTSYDWNVVLSRHPRSTLRNYPSSSTVANIFSGWTSARAAYAEYSRRAVNG